MSVREFSDSFVEEYLEAFTEMKRLGSLAGERISDGKSAEEQDHCIGRIFFALKALSNKANLTEKQIEALEFDLRSCNKSLAVPSVQPIVDYSSLPNHYTMRMEAGVFVSSGYDLLFGRTLIMGTGLFTLSGMDLEFVYNSAGGDHYTLTMGVGSFTLSGMDVNLVFVPVLADVSSQLTSVSSESIFESTFDPVIDEPTTLTLQGTSDSDSGTVRFATSITVSVVKTTNGGAAADAGVIEYRKNGTTVHSTGFSTNDIINDSYEFTGLVSTDDISTLIQEG